MEPTWNNAGIAHENGDVEQAHHRFKVALDQALRVRGSREFSDRDSYERFVAELVKQRNQTRKERFHEELSTLAPLPLAPLAPCRELRVRVSRFSTIQVLGNTYSVPSRLIGTRLLVRLRAERVEGYVGRSLAFSFPRLVGKQQK
ncbi:MAG: IS21 family transposase, partial [Ktedonobacteraceae bacterium]|nr:IS21 family transposase [Ktedonobacteraceae bacterium]